MSINKNKEERLNKAATIEPAGTETATSTPATGPLCAAEAWRIFGPVRRAQELKLALLELVAGGHLLVGTHPTRNWIGWTESKPGARLTGDAVPANAVLAEARALVEATPQSRLEDGYSVLFPELVATARRRYGGQSFRQAVVDPALIRQRLLIERWHGIAGLGWHTRELSPTGLALARQFWAAHREIRLGEAAVDPALQAQLTPHAPTLLWMAQAGRRWPPWTNRVDERQEADSGGHGGDWDGAWDVLSGIGDALDAAFSAISDGIDSGGGDGGGGDGGGDGGGGD